MSLAVAPIEDNAAILERVITVGDLSRLTPLERTNYYAAVCRSVGLNPLTQPFQYLSLNNRLVLYATKAATEEQLLSACKRFGKAERDTSDPDYATWLATGHDAAGRVDTEIGSVSIKGLAGEARANATMKALTKAKRRLTLSLAGLGWLDETEVDSIPAARPVDVDAETGEIRAQPASLGERISERKAAVTAKPVAPIDEPVSVTGTADTEAATGEDTMTGPAAALARPVAAETPTARCDGFDVDAGACKLDSGHTGNHRAKDGSAWK